MRIRQAHLHQYVDQTRSNRRLFDPLIETMKLLACLHVEPDSGSMSKSCRGIKHVRSKM
jgi:hypothetical protein